MNISLDEIRSKAPEGATGYYESEKYTIRYIRKTPKNYFYQNANGGRWWKVPITSLRYIKDNYKPLYKPL